MIKLARIRALEKARQIVKEKWFLILLIPLLLSLTACGDQSATSQPHSHASDIAFGQTGRTAKTQVWYIVRGTKTPRSSTPLKAVAITQNGRATAFQVPASFTLGAAANLSVSQLQKKGTTFAKQAFVRKRQTLTNTAKHGLAQEKRILKADQHATVVSFAAIKTDRRAVANYQQLLAHLKTITFRAPSPLPFSVTVVKKQHRVKQETIKVAAYALKESATTTTTSAIAYQKSRHQIFTVPYTLTSPRAVRIGQHDFGYYRSADHSELALTKIAHQDANVKFDPASTTP